MSSARERERREREWEKEREEYSKIHKKPRRDAAANPKTLQHGPGIWPSAAAVAVAVARATTMAAAVSWGGPITRPSWSTCTLLAWLWLWLSGCAANQHKKLWVSCEFCAKVRFASFSNLILSSRCPVCYLPACPPAAAAAPLPSTSSLPALPLPFATCENLCGKFFARTLCSKQKLVLRVGFTQAPQAHQARAEQCRAEQAQATSAQYCCSLHCVLLCHKLCQVSEARARGFLLASTLHTVQFLLPSVCPSHSRSLSLCPFVALARW